MVKQVKLGSSGLVVSNLCLGCMNFGGSTPEKEALDILKTSFDAGVFFWDTADVYSMGLSEEIVGKAIKQIGHRDQIVVATKFEARVGPGPNDFGLSRHHIKHAVEASLRRLQTDYIDLYQMHRPCDDTPIEETLEALDSLVQAGKILYYGTSVFSSWQMAEVEWTARTRNFTKPTCEQAPYNILDRRIENDRASFIRKYGWGLIPWSPLAGGQLLGKYKAENIAEFPPGSRASQDTRFLYRMNVESINISNQFVKLCKEAGQEPAQVAIAWLLHQSIVTAPIIGPRTKEHMVSVLPAADLNLSTDILSSIDELVPPGTAVADFLRPSTTWHVGHLPGLTNTNQ